jgi:hypothetical protein
MRQNNETIFFSLGQLNLQPSMFPSKLLTFYQWSTGWVFGFLGGLYLGFFGGLFTEIFISQTNWLVGGLVMGVIGGLINGIAAGLEAKIELENVSGEIYPTPQHKAAAEIGSSLRYLSQCYILHFCLRYMHFLPWNVRSFLDDATDRRLLRRIDGGYRFIHPLLLDNIVDLDSPVPSDT